MASPKPKPKPTPVAKPPAKPSPGAKAAAAQQAASNKAFATQQAAARKAAAAPQNLAFQRRANVSNNSRAPIPTPKAATRPGSGYQPTQRGGGPAPRGTQNPLEHLLTPGGGITRGGMDTGTMKNNPLKRILRGQ